MNLDLLLKRSQCFGCRGFCGSKDLLIGYALKAELQHRLPTGADIHHFADSRDARSQHLQRSQLRRDLQRISRAPLVLHAHQPGDPVRERQVIEKAVKEGEFQMRVRVDEARDNGASRIER